MVFAEPTRPKGRIYRLCSHTAGALEIPYAPPAFGNGYLTAIREDSIRQAVRSIAETDAELDPILQEYITAGSWHADILAYALMEVGFHSDTIAIACVQSGLLDGFATNGIYGFSTSLADKRLSGPRRTALLALAGRTCARIHLFVSIPHLDKHTPEFRAGLEPSLSHPSEYQHRDFEEISSFLSPERNMQWHMDRESWVRSLPFRDAVALRKLLSYGEFGSVIPTDITEIVPLLTSPRDADREGAFEALAHRGDDESLRTLVSRITQEARTNTLRRLAFRIAMWPVETLEACFETLDDELLALIGKTIIPELSATHSVSVAILSVADKRISDIPETKRQLCRLIMP